MGVLEWILVVIRWGHAAAAVAWVGGGFFYLMVLRPAARRSRGLPAETGAAVRDEFRSVTATAIAVLALTGAVLSAARLTGGGATLAYAAVLGVKIGLALYMFYVARLVRRGDGGDVGGAADVGNGGGGRWRRWGRRLTSPMALLVLGVGVIGLSDVLDALVEYAPAG